MTTKSSYKNLTYHVMLHWDPTEYIVSIYYMLTTTAVAMPSCIIMKEGISTAAVVISLYLHYLLTYLPTLSHSYLLLLYSGLYMHKDCSIVAIEYFVFVVTRYLVGLNDFNNYNISIHK